MRFDVGDNSRQRQSGCRYSMRSKRPITIRDLLTLTLCSSVLLGVGIQLYGILLDPRKFADSLGYQAAALTLIVCSFGLVLFPLSILVVGIFALRKSESAFKPLYAMLFIASAISSVPIAYVIGKSCAFALA